MEYFDIVDEEGRPTGKTVSRAQAHAEDILHRTAHVWIIREGASDIEVLLQKRSETKDSFPGCWDTSSAGHIPAGNEPPDSARRELYEELGIAADADELIPAGTFRIHYEDCFHGAVFRDNEIAFLYVYEKPVDISCLKLQAEEVRAVDWFDLNEVYQRIRQKDPQICADIKGVECLLKWLQKRNL